MADSDVVIRVEGLGKKYSLNHELANPKTNLREAISSSTARWLNPFTLAGQLQKAQRRNAQPPNACEEEFWALKDVSFEIRRGERLGIIGRNGAGKSTLLKILSRITEPTTGRVEIRGRVASLLEVGTGFHPELTGRENIYPNGAILGMTRREIRSKFDEIVDFAEVEKFLDTPVKRYSSGMYVRLAFAVAAHLDPEILVVDEVLAVGDASFQKKCLGKLENASGQDGKTILFVSHNVDAIRRLCSKAVYLSKGKLKSFQNTESCIKEYLSSDNSASSQSNPIRAGFGRKNTNTADSIFVKIGLATHDYKPKLSFNMTESILIFAIWEILEIPINCKLNFHIKNGNGNTVFCSICDQDINMQPGSLAARASLSVPPLLLNTGKYTLSVYFTSFCPITVHASWEDILSFDIQEDLPYRLHQGFNQRLPGDVILSDPAWNITLLNNKLAQTSP